MLLINSRDLRALDTQPSHQAALVKGEGVDAAMHGIGSEAAGHSFINKHDTWAGPDLPSMGIVYPIDCFLVHEEERVTILLNTGL